MSYFRELPDISAVSLLPGRQRSDERVLVKNIYKRARLRSDIDYAVTAFDFRVVREGDRPDTIAATLYGDPELDWVILITNNITNVRNQWPLSNNDLHDYLIDKYGSEEKLLDPHHYETKEIRDQFNRTILSPGLEVDSDFTFTYLPFGSNSVKTVAAAGPVSNYKYESKKNDAKRLIRVLKEEYLSGFISDMRNIMKYETSSQYINRTTKAGYNPRESGV